jgi:probable rRNA maturation factor
MISLTIHLDLAFRKWEKAFDKMGKKIEMAVAAAFLDAKKPRAFTGRNFEIGVILGNDSMMKDLNHTYRGKNQPTNVLSFPQMKMKGLSAKTLDALPGKGPIPLGDVVLAHQTIAKECKAQGKTLENHTLHLIVHGTLHLLGYDHMSARDAKTMEKLECDILASLGYPDPYHEAKPQKKRRR